LYEVKKDFLGKRHLEMIYALLPAWGMHRMGDTKTKIIPFDLFSRQVENHKMEFIKIKEKPLKSLTKKEIENFAVFLTQEFHVSESNAHLVSSSKVIHHILPNLISPIDREYSIRFMKENKNCISRKQINLNNETIYASVFITGMYDFMGLQALWGEATAKSKPPKWKSIAVLKLASFL
jgi:hypothetical protein